MQFRIAGALAGCIFAAALWLTAASCAFLWLADLWDSPYISTWSRPWQWAVYVQWFGRDISECIYLIIAALIASSPIIIYVRFVVFGSMGGFRMRPFADHSGIERGVTDNFGRARFATLADMGEKLKGPGVLICTTSRDGEENFVFDDPNDGPRHAISVAGSGSDKTTTAVTRLWLYRGPRVVFDPSCEIGPILDGYAEGHPKFHADQRRPLSEKGFDVYTVDLHGHGFNILEWIDITDPEADPYIRTAVSWIHNSGAIPAAQQKDPFWTTWGKALITCVLAHLLYSTEPNKTLEYFYEGIATPEDDMLDLLRGIYHTSNSRMAKYIAGQLMGCRAPQTFAGIYSNAVSAVDWLGVDVYARAVSGNSFSPTVILDPNSVLFVNIPLRTMLVTPTIGRAIMGALFNVLFQADGDVADWVLFEIDEAWLLGAADEIKLAHVTGRKYRACVHTIWPSESLLNEVWTPTGAKILRDMTSWCSWNAIQDGDTAEGLSKNLGAHGVVAYNESDNSGTQTPRGLTGGWGSKSSGMNISKHEIKHQLADRYDILRAPADMIWVMLRNFPYPLQCYTAPYYRYPKIKQEVNDNRFYRGANRRKKQLEAITHG